MARAPSGFGHAMTGERSLLPLLPLRLFSGWVFLTAGLSKMSAGWLQRPELAHVVDGWIREGRPYRFFLPLLQGQVLPHAKLFAQIVVWGEVTIGLLLLAGLLTRYASAAGLLLVTAYLLARGDGATANPTAPFVPLLLTMALSNPGLALGVDGAMRGKVPRWLS